MKASQAETTMMMTEMCCFTEHLFQSSAGVDWTEYYSLSLVDDGTNSFCGGPYVVIKIIMGTCQVFLRQTD